MAVKVEVHGANSFRPSYPCLMIDSETGLLLFMNDFQCGTVIQGGTTNYFPGYHGTNWKMHKLTNFPGRVTLENK